MKMEFQSTHTFAQLLDRQDPLRQYRKQFHFPRHEGRVVLYFCGNSLGLQLKTVKTALLAELEHWKTHGVEGHFRGDMPWMHYHRFLTEASARLIGAEPSEVVVMNTLTTNLHLMMVSFYRPTAGRYKIIMESHAFPSDQYAVESQVRWHGLDPEQAIVEVAPRAGEETLRTTDILAAIRQHGSEAALVLFSGVQYYTGQWFDMEAITRAGHEAGAYVGFDLAHAAGNVPMLLHDWGVDFAVWCSYKYLNSGPGGPSGLFVHERHGGNPELPRFAGWWGHDAHTRFLMQKGFHPMQGAEGWQLSNAQVLSFAAHKANLDLFDEAGMAALRQKSLLLTGYLEFLIDMLGRAGHPYRIITPRHASERGCQISILTGSEGKQLFEFLSENGVVADWREPNVIRVAPVPLYNRFEDVWLLADLLRRFGN
jgi:kynureninase